MEGDEGSEGFTLHDALSQVPPRQTIGSLHNHPHAGHVRDVQLQKTAHIKLSEAKNKVKS
jgi:hypothetical protein